MTKYNFINVIANGIYYEMDETELREKVVRRWEVPREDVTQEQMFSMCEHIAEDAYDEYIRKIIKEYDDY